MPLQERERDQVTPLRRELRESCVHFATLLHQGQDVEGLIRIAVVGLSHCGDVESVGRGAALTQPVERTAATEHQQPAERVGAARIEARGIGPRVSVRFADDLLGVFGAAQNRGRERVQLADRRVVQLFERALVSYPHLLHERGQVTHGRRLGLWNVVYCRLHDHGRRS